MCGSGTGSLEARASARGLLLTLVVFSACLETKPLGLPDVEALGTSGGDGFDEVRAWLVVAAGDVGRAQMLTLDPSSDFRAGVVMRPTDRLFAFGFPDSLESLGLEAGVQRPVGPLRPVPRPFSLFEASPSARSWTRIEEESVRDLVDSLELPSFGVGDCEDREGCFRITGETRSGLSAHCEVPCRLPEGPRSPPSPASGPTLTPCPSGWRLDEPTQPASGRNDDVAHCTPPARQECAEGEEQPIDEAECRPFGAPCAEDGWPKDVGADAIHVDPLASIGGDGSRAAPLSKIADALSAAPDHGEVALRVGAYEENLTISRPLRLIGACVAGVRLAGSAGAPGVRVRADAEIASLSIIAAEGGIVAEQGARVELTEVHAAGGSSEGIVVRAGASLVARELVVGPATRNGLWVDGSSGTGVTSGLVERAVIRDVTGDGVLVEGAGARLDLIDAVVERTSDLPRGPQGKGLFVREEAAVRVERVGLLKNAEHGIAVWSDAQAEGQDLFILGDGVSRGYGVDVFSGGRITALRLDVEAKHYGLFINAAGKGTFRDVRVADSIDMGVVVRSRGALESLARAAVVRAARAGVDVFEGDASIEDLVVALTRAVPDDDVDHCSVHVHERGAGVRVRGSSRVRAERVLVDRAAGVGVAVGNRQPNLEGGGAILAECDDTFVEDVEIRDLEVCDSKVGVASYFGSGRFERVRLTGNSLAGIDIALGYLDLEDATVSGTPTSVGLLVSTRFPHANDRRLGPPVLRRLLLEDHGVAGLRVEDQYEARVEEARVERSAVGLQLLSSDFEPSVLTETVVYRGNQRIFETQAGR